MHASVFFGNHAAGAIIPSCQPQRFVMKVSAHGRPVPLGPGEPRTLDPARTSVEHHTSSMRTGVRPKV
jgi:hypothetical protein